MENTIRHWSSISLCVDVFLEDQKFKKSTYHTNCGAGPSYKFRYKVCGEYYYVFNGKEAWIYNVNLVKDMWRKDYTLDSFDSVYNDGVIFLDLLTTQ